MRDRRIDGIADDFDHDTVFFVGPGPLLDAFAEGEDGDAGHGAHDGYEDVEGLDWLGVMEVGETPFGRVGLG